MLGKISYYLYRHSDLDFIEKMTVSKFLLFQNVEGIGESPEIFEKSERPLTATFGVGSKTTGVFMDEITGISIQDRYHTF